MSKRKTTTRNTVTTRKTKKLKQTNDENPKISVQEMETLNVLARQKTAFILFELNQIYIIERQIQSSSSRTVLQELDMKEHMESIRTILTNPKFFYLLQPCKKLTGDMSFIYALCGGLQNKRQLSKDLINFRIEICRLLFQHQHIFMQASGGGDRPLLHNCDIGLLSFFVSYEKEQRNIAISRNIIDIDWNIVHPITHETLLHTMIYRHAWGVLWRFMADENADYFFSQGRINPTLHNFHDQDFSDILKLPSTLEGSKRSELDYYGDLFQIVCEYHWPKFLSDFTNLLSDYICTDLIPAFIIPFLDLQNEYKKH